MIYKIPKILRKGNNSFTMLIESYRFHEFKGIFPLMFWFWLFIDRFVQKWSAARQFCAFHWGIKGKIFQKIRQIQHSIKDVSNLCICCISE